jgi:hypothetical protein
MTMTLIQTTTLGTAAATIEFTSIPQIYTDLLLVSSARNSGSAANEIAMTFNSQTTNRSERGLFGSGSAASSFTTTILRAGQTTDSTQTANTFGNSSCYISNYAGSTNKRVSVDTVTENNATAASNQIVDGLWANTAAITSIELTIPSSGTFVAGTTISLYGILKGSDGIVTIAFS